MIRFTGKEFELLTKYMNEHYGIDLSKKRVIAECRMSQEMEKRGVTSLKQYMEMMEADRTGRMRATLLNRLTTNYTYFMREPKHFEFLEQKILPEIRPETAKAPFRVWSAGCSSGEECYTLAMLLQNYTDGGGWLPSFEILGTDLSENVIGKAKEGRYPLSELDAIPPFWQQKYCRKDKERSDFTIIPQLREKVRFQLMNLLRPNAGIDRFDLILCRNVMIYFDDVSRKKLIENLYRALKPGGYLFVGHTELLPRDHELLTYVCPAIYRK